MKRLTTRGIRTAEAIRDREEFVTSGSLRAEWVTSVYRYSGYLSGEDAQRWTFDSVCRAYVVYSYATPIAWWTEQNGWYRVKAKFSLTTTKHQSNLYLIRDEVKG